MLLWLMNLGLAGGDTVFFVSGAIPLVAEAAIIVQYEADIIVPTDGSTSVGT